MGSGHTLPTGDHVVGFNETQVCMQGGGGPLATVCMAVVTVGTGG